MRNPELFFTFGWLRSNGLQFAPGGGVYGGIEGDCPTDDKFGKLYEGILGLGFNIPIPIAPAAGKAPFNNPLPADFATSQISSPKPLPPTMLPNPPIAPSPPTDPIAEDAVGPTAPNISIPGPPAAPLLKNEFQRSNSGVMVFATELAASPNP